jgi:hypothetical protein
MTDIVDASIAAAKGVAKSMTSGLVKFALSESWSPKTAVKLGVAFDPSSSTFEILNESDSDVQNEEYGTDQNPPAPAIRKFSSRTAQYEAEFINSLSKKLGIEL